MVLIFSELLHKHFRTQPQCTEMFKNSSSVWPAFFPRAWWLAAVSKNRPFWSRSLSRNGLCVTLFTQFYIWHLHNKNTDLMRPEGPHWSVGILGEGRIPTRPAVFGFRALSTFASWFLILFPSLSQSQGQRSETPSHSTRSWRTEK